MGKTEVTQAQWTEKMGSNPSAFQGASYPDAANRPVESMPVNMIQAFNTATGLRLPTEAEWQYACRAGTTTARYGVLNDIAWCSENSGGQSHQVAGKLPNALGLYDTLGNVSEWTSDWVGAYTAEAQTNPTGPLSGTLPICCGGNWLYLCNESRASQRVYAQPSNHGGIRVARNP